MFKKRTLSKFLKEANKNFPALLITGPRQVGKTTLLKNLSKGKYTYITLDDPEMKLLAKEDPKLFLQRFAPPLIIDEIQYAPELLPIIKMIIDKDRKNGMFWLTGSQQFHLMKNVSESLAGRVAILDLQGLSQSEKNNNPNMDSFLPTKDYLNGRDKICQKFDLLKLYEIIWKGSFPEVFLLNKNQWELFYTSYIQTYIERDVRDLVQVKNKKTFFKFLQIIAARTGQLVNYSDLANSIGIDLKTVKSWISILEASRLIYILEPYYSNLTKRLTKTQKLYFLDTGLCCYLTGWDNSKVLEKGAMSGEIFETYVISEMLKSYWHNGKRAPFFFYRDKEKREIDLLIYKNGTLYPIEIKKKSNPSKKDIKHFDVLNKLNVEIGHGIVICLSDKILPINVDVDMVPIGYI